MITNRNLPKTATTTPTPKDATQISTTAPVNAAAVVTISPDAMTAKITLSAPKNGGKTLTEEAILAALKENGVVYGIKTNFIPRLAKYQIYDKRFLIAAGTLPEDGKNEELVCHFDTTDLLAPRVLEDGSTDYKNMGFGHSVEENEALATIIPAVPGKNGFDVLGNEHEGKPGVALSPSPVGTNVKLSEDGTKILATSTGNASLKDNKVHVRKEMTVSHVDQSTGNIMFAGDVFIKGDVRDGFTVRAGGSINVGGVVENAILVAGRDIIIKTGVHGEESNITAGGGIRTGYIEMGTFRAHECIYADVVLSANLISEDKVILSGKKGCLIGGSCRAVTYFEAKTVGNEANTATVLELIDPTSQNPERDEINAKIKECTERINVLNDAWRTATIAKTSTEEKKRTVAQLLSSRKEAETEARELSMQLSKIASASEKDGTNLMVIHEHIYPNVSLNFDGTILRNTFMRPACRITRKKDKITFGTNA